MDGSIFFNKFILKIPKKKTKLFLQTTWNLLEPLIIINRVCSIKLTLYHCKIWILLNYIWIWIIIFCSVLMSYLLEMSRSRVIGSTARCSSQVWVSMRRLFTFGIYQACVLMSDTCRFWYWSPIYITILNYMIF